MNIIPFKSLSLAGKVEEAKNFDNQFIVNILVLAERCEKNRKNDENFLILDKELEERARYSYKVLGGIYAN